MNVNRILRRALGVVVILVVLITGLAVGGLLDGSGNHHGTPHTHLVTRAYGQHESISASCRSTFRGQARQAEAPKPQAHEAQSDCPYQVRRGKAKTHKVSTARLRRLGAPRSMIATSRNKPYCGPIPNPTSCSAGATYETSDYTQWCGQTCGIWQFTLKVDYFHNQISVWVPHNKSPYIDCNDFSGAVVSDHVQQCQWLKTYNGLSAHAGGDPNDVMTATESMSQSIAPFSWALFTVHRSQTIYAYGTGQENFSSSQNL